MTQKKRSSSSGPKYRRTRRSRLRQGKSMIRLESKEGFHPSRFTAWIKSVATWPSLCLRKTHRREYQCETGKPRKSCCQFWTLQRETWPCTHQSIYARATSKGRGWFLTRGQREGPIEAWCAAWSLSTLKQNRIEPERNYQWFHYRLQCIRPVQKTTS